MAVKNRGVALSALQSRIQQEVDRQVEQRTSPALENLGLVETMTGDTKFMDLTWMRRYSMMREWVGEREMRDDRQFFKSRMRNRKFEDTIRIDIEDIEDDIGMLNPEGEAQQLTQAYEDRIEWEQHAYLVHSFDKNFVGGSTTGQFGETIYEGSVDGEPLLSDSHPYYQQIEFNESAPRGERLVLQDGGEFSNLVNTAFSADALWQARRDFQKLVTFRGKPANFGQPDTLIVPPDLEREARKVVERPQVLDDQDAGAALANETQGIVDIYVDPYLVGDVTIDIDFNNSTYTDQTIDLSNVWFLANTTSNLSPFVMWDRKDLELQTPSGVPSLTDENPAEGEVDYMTFFEDAFVMGARTRFGMSFGMPQVIYGSLGNTTLS